MEIPTASLLYLFGGDVLPHPHFSLRHLWTTEHAVDLPCRGGTVVLGPLEEYLFAWTFWELHESGAVELALEQPQPTRQKRRDWLGLDVSVRRGTKALDPGGVLAAELLQLCDVEPILISAVIRSWGKAKGVNPNRMIFLPLDAIVELIHLDTCNFLGAEPLPPDQSRLNCEEIRLLRPQFAKLRTQFGAFVDRNVDLATALLRCCDAGLAQLRPPKYAGGVGPFGP